MVRTRHFFLLSTCIWALTCQPSTKQMTPDTQREPPMLLGTGDRTAFQQDKAFGWFQKNYKAYKVDRESLLHLDSTINNLAFTIVMGTWCPDSRREVPRFYKILDVLGVTEDQITLINVDRSKHTPNGDEIGLDIHHVPTFIIYRDGGEIGRIVESPWRTLENDLGLILNGEPPTPRYED